VIPGRSAFAGPLCHGRSACLVLGGVEAAAARD
jgi:hypothetical protein